MPIVNNDQIEALDLNTVFNEGVVPSVNVKDDKRCHYVFVEVINLQTPTEQIRIISFPDDCDLMFVSLTMKRASVKTNVTVTVTAIEPILIRDVLKYNSFKQLSISGQIDVDPVISADRMSRILPNSDKFFFKKDVPYKVTFSCDAGPVGSSMVGFMVRSNRRPM